MATVDFGSNALLSSSADTSTRNEASPLTDSINSRTTSANDKYHLSQLRKNNGSSSSMQPPSPQSSSTGRGLTKDYETSPLSTNDLNGHFQHHTTASLDEDELPEPICGGCKRLIDEESADAGVIHFATQLWHVDCFRCAKCRNPVTTDRDDILLLSDGHPICGQCNYSCQICSLPIMEEAIMTGDESYHASCFVCRSCRTPIAELVFAKTSQGIYCMNCHNQRVARSRRHAEKKRQAAAAAAASAAAAGARNDLAQLTLRQESKDSHYDVSIPAGPVVTEASPVFDSPGLNWRSEPHRQQQQKTSAEIGELGSSPRSPKGPLQPIQAPMSPKNSSHSLSRRPLNPPPPPSLRSIRQSAARPSTAESLNSETDGRVASNKHSDYTLPGRASDSHLFHDTSAQSDGADDSHKVRDRGNRKEEFGEASASSPAKQLPSLTAKRPLDSSRTLDKEAPESLPKDTSISSHNPLGNMQAAESSRFLGVRSTKSEGRISKSFSFYDPDIVSLMDSFGRLGSSDDVSSDGMSSRELVRAKSPISDRSSHQERPITDDISAPRRAMDEASRPVLDADPVEDAASQDVVSVTHADEVLEGIPRSTSIADRMRQSLENSKSDGKIKLDKAMLGALLQEFDNTHERVKALQQKYDRIRRASQQAAQGFSSAREEYEQEVRARYDAEAELLNLKREIHAQANQLAELTAEKNQQDRLGRHTQEVKSSIYGLEKELSKLRIERDIHAAEVAGLLAMQESHAPTGTSVEDSIKRNLVARIEGVKERFRGELQDSLAERDELLREIESLRQSRDTYTEEARHLTAQTEELNATLLHVEQRLAHAQAAEKLMDARAAQAAIAWNAASQRTPFAAGFKGKGTSSFASTITANDNSSQSHLPDTNIDYAFAAPIPAAKAEAAPKKFKWMKGTKLMTGEAARAVLHSGITALTPPIPPPKNGISGVTTRDAHNTQAHHRELSNARLDGFVHHHGTRHVNAEGSSPSGSNGVGTSGDIVYKEHLFQPLNILRPIRCFACQKNMWGQTELRCQFCHQACHVKCLQILPTSCNQPYTRSDAISEPVGPSMFGRKLIEQVRAEATGQTIPLIVQRCVESVERQGMDYEGIYRKSGGSSQLKIITQLFEKGQAFDLNDADRFNDVSAITSVLKNYFRELPEPLLTFDLHERFVECAENKSLDAAAKHGKMQELVKSLPREHFDTLKLLVLHLHRVALHSEENRMSSRNLGVVFGPTLMRSSDATQEFAHMGGKAMAIEYMIENCDLFD